MIYSTITKFEGILYPDIELLNNTLVNNLTDINFISNDPEQAKIIIASSLAFFTGLIHVGDFALRLVKLKSLSYFNYI